MTKRQRINTMTRAWSTASDPSTRTWLARRIRRLVGQLNSAHQRAMALRYLPLELL